MFCSTLWSPASSVFAAFDQLSAMLPGLSQDGVVERIIGNTSLVALLSGIASAAWKTMTWAMDWVRFHYFAVRRFSLALPLELDEKALRSKAEIYCLVIKHGSDEYLKNMASPKERTDGRQLLWVRKVQVRRGPEGKAILHLRLDVHRALGTQFKCFAKARRLKEVGEVQALLKSTKKVSDVRQSDSAYKDRVYFYLEDLRPAVHDPNTFGNNFFFPA